MFLFLITYQLVLCLMRQYMPASDTNITCVLDWVFTASRWKPGDGTVSHFLKLSLFSDYTLSALDCSDEGAGSVYSDLAWILLGIAYLRKGQMFW